MIMNDIRLDDFLIFDSTGFRKMPSHVWGAVLATLCQRCDHPLLLDCREGHPGSDQAHPSACPGCNTEWIVDLRLQSRKIYIHAIDELT